MNSINIVLNKEQQGIRLQLVLHNKMVWLKGSIEPFRRELDTCYLMQDYPRYFRQKL